MTLHNVQNIIRIEPGSEAYVKLAEMIARHPVGGQRAISITSSPHGVQLKWGGGTWTTPLKTSDPSTRRGDVCGDPDCGCS